MVHDTFYGVTGYNLKFLPKKIILACWYDLQGRLIKSCIQSYVQKNIKNLNSDFSKYSLIPNQFGTHLIQRKGPIHDLF